MLIFHKKWLLLLLIAAGVFIFLLLEFFGIIWHNSLFASQYKTKGFDVSHHQGQIDWQKVANTHRYSFVYIKATEGDDFIDDSFDENWQQARNHGLSVGAYHFFSLRSSGQKQADLFIKTVPKDNSSLPPVIDIEIDLNANKKQVQFELKELASRLENFYQKRPILYVTYDTYKTYVEGDFLDYHIWIRDVFGPPSLKGKNWLIWQYNNRGRVDGINTYVDINAVNGNLDSILSQFP